MRRNTIILLEGGDEIEISFFITFLIYKHSIANSFNISLVLACEQSLLCRPATREPLLVTIVRPLLKAPSSINFQLFVRSFVTWWTSKVLQLIQTFIFFLSFMASQLLLLLLLLQVKQKTKEKPLFKRKSYTYSLWTQNGKMPETKQAVELYLLLGCLDYSFLFEIGASMATRWRHCNFLTSSICEKSWHSFLKLLVRFESPGVNIYL